MHGPINIRFRKIHKYFENKQVILVLEIVFSGSDLFYVPRQRVKNVSFCLDGDVILDVLVV